MNYINKNVRRKKFQGVAESQEFLCILYSFQCRRRNGQSFPLSLPEFILRQDQLPPIWPRPPTWPNDVEKQRRYCHSIRMPWNPSLVCYGNQKKLDLAHRHFRYLMQQYDQSIQKPAKDWIPLLVVGRICHALKNDSTNMTAREFFQRVIENIRDPSYNTFLPDYEPPFVASRCDTCCNELCIRMRRLWRSLLQSWVSSTRLDGTSSRL